MASIINATSGGSGGLVTSGDTSGALQIQTSGTTAITVDSSQNVTVAGTLTSSGVITSSTGALYPLVSGTVNAGGTNPFPSSAGPTAVNFTGIPSTAKRITVMFSGVSTNGSSQPRFQIGPSSGVETSGYVGTCSQIGVGAATALMPVGGFEIYSGALGNIISGTAVISLLTGSTWVFTFLGASTDGTTLTFTSGGTKTITGTLERVRVTTANGTDLFDLGSINIMWE